MIVADAGPIIAFARIGRLPVLREVLGEVLVPDAVYDELVTKGKGRPGSAEVAQSPWIHRQAVEARPPSPTDGLLHLHEGEREAIVLAHERELRLLIDEQRGREAAHAYGIDTMGSLGVLAEAKRRGLVDQASALLRAMIGSGYWMDADLVMTFLAEVGEVEDTEGERLDPSDPDEVATCP